MVRRSLFVPPGVRLTLADESVVLSPDRDTVTERLTVPLNRFRLVRVSVTVPDVVRWTPIELGLAEREKSGATWTVTRTLLEWESEPEIPVIVAV
jgi:hypothetical protein